jgi:hypothetical protein
MKSGPLRQEHERVLREMDPGAKLAFFQREGKAPWEERAEISPPKAD